jgi:hypothetical protein
MGLVIAGISAKSLQYVDKRWTIRQVADKKTP